MRLKDGEYRLDPKDGIGCSPKSEFKLLSAHVLSDQQEWTPRNTNRPHANQRANEAGGNDDEVELDLKESTWNGK